MTTNPDYLTREDIMILATREVIDLGEWPFIKPVQADGVDDPCMGDFDESGDAISFGLSP